MLIDKLADRRYAPLQEKLRAAHELILLLEQQKDHLERQIEWHNRLLRTLDDQHGVAKAEEAVPLADGRLVGARDQVPASEGAHQH